MNYQNNYELLIESAKSKKRKLGESCYEVHHIIPRSLGGLDTEENLVILTPREHYLAHYLLWKISEGESKSKMAYAFYFMSNRDNCKIISSRAYERAKKEFTERTSKLKSKKVICLQSLKVFKSAREASKEMKIGFRSISKSCKEHSSTKGYNFEFFDENKKYEKKELAKIHKQKNLKIQCLETGKIFNSLQEMSKELNIPRSTISKYLKENKRIKDYHYKKLNEKENNKC